MSQGAESALCAAVVAGAVMVAMPSAARLGPRSRLLPAGGTPVLGPVVVLAASGLLASSDGPTLILGFIVLASAADTVRRLGRRRRQRQIESRRARVLAVCESLAADIRAGVAPVTALESASAIWPALAGVVRAARYGGEVPAALRELAREPGSERVMTIAAAWSVAHRTGAGMAGALDLAAGSLRDDQMLAREIATEIAAARATAAILTLLPLGVLVLGQGVGGDAVGFLTGTPAGIGCLATGLALTHGGLAWLDAIADGVRR